jgi:hypothetical protein
METVWGANGVDMFYCPGLSWPWTPSTNPISVRSCSYQPSSLLPNPYLGHNCLRLAENIYCSFSAQARQEQRLVQTYFMGGDRFRSSVQPFRVLQFYVSMFTRIWRLGYYY